MLKWKKKYVNEYGISWHCFILVILTFNSYIIYFAKVLVHYWDNNSGLTANNFVVLVLIPLKNNKCSEFTQRVCWLQWLRADFKNFSIIDWQVLEPCWDREQRSQLSWRHYLYLKLPEHCCHRLYHPFNTLSSRGSACSRICVCLAAPLSSFLRISLHKPDGHLWCQIEVFTATLSHLFTLTWPVSYEEWESALCFQIRAICFFFSSKSVPQ